MGPAEPVSSGIVFLVLGIMMALFFYGRWRYDLVALGGLLTLTLGGAIPPDQAFSGLGHPAVISVAAVLVLTAGLVQSGAAEALAFQLARVVRKPGQLVPVLGLGVTALSTVINNVGALSLLMPVGRNLGHRFGVPPARSFMVLSFGSILGGLVLLISTPINLIVSGFRRDALGHGFRLFDFVPVGLTLAGLGVLYLIMASPYLLPASRREEEVSDLFEVDRYTSEVLVSEESTLAGTNLGTCQEFLAGDVVLAAILRGRNSILAPGSQEWLEAGDRLIVEATPENLALFVEQTHSQLLGPKATLALQEAGKGIRLLEAVVLPQASLVGRTVRDLRVRQDYGLNLLAVARQGTRIVTRLVDTPLRAGDILLVQGPVQGAVRFFQDQDCLPLARRDLSMARRGDPRVAAVLFGGALLLSAVGGVQVQISFALGAVLMVLLKQLRIRQAYEAMELPVLVLLACMLPIGHALESSGGARLIAETLHRAGASLPPQGILSLFILVTALLANTMNNKAAAALMAPVGLELARTLHCSPDSFLMATAVGAELVFLSPMGHQSNLLVMGQCGYRFFDFVRFGAPLLLLMLLAATLVIPQIWPLQTM